LARAAAEQLNLSHVRPEYYAWRSDAGPDGLDYFVIEPGPILDQAMYARHRAL
jgi:chloramphenicol 3-O phosphotransferase